MVVGLVGDSWVMMVFGVRWAQKCWDSVAWDENDHSSSEIPFQHSLNSPGTSDLDVIRLRALTITPKITITIT